MTAKRFCACIVTLALLVATGALGEIVRDYDWSGSQVGGGASSGNEKGTGAYSLSNSSMSSGFGGGEGYIDILTTEQARCRWSYYAYTYAYAETELITGEFPAAYAYASATALVDQGLGYANVQDALVVLPCKDQWGGARGAGPFSDYDAGEDVFQAYRGAYACHTAVAATSVALGSPNTAYAHACVTARVTLSEVPEE